MTPSLTHRPPGTAAGDHGETGAKSKEYIRPMPATWFLRNRHLLAYTLRELSSFFVAGYAIFLLIVLARQGQGKEAFHRFFDNVLQSPVSLVLHLIALAFVVLHSATSFNGIGRVMVIRRGEDRVSPTLIAAVNYGLWIIVSVLILRGILTWIEG